MRAVGYRVRRLLRAQWRATVLLTVVVAAVSGVVLALAAGAQRTSTAPDRYTAATGGGFDGEVEQESGPPRTSEIAGLPGVSSVQGLTFVFGALSRPGGDPTPDAFVFAGSHRALGLNLVDGRPPDPSRPGEFVATRSFTDALGVDLGARFELVTLDQEQADQAGFDAFGQGPKGPRIDAVLVGVLDGPTQLDDPTPLTAFGPSVLDEGAGVSASVLSVRLRPGTDLADLRTQLDTLPDGDALALEPSELISSDVRTAVEGQARGLWLLAAVGAVAALVVLGQLLTRSVRLSEEEGPRLAALGFSRGQRLAESVGRAAVPILTGTLGGVVVAVVLSRLFPTGFVRPIEPHPGLRVEAGVLAAGAALLIGALVLWTVAALTMSREVRRAERAPAPVEWAAVRSGSAALSTGLRFAFTRSRRDRGSVRAAVSGMLLSTALLVGAVVFGSSLGRLVSDGNRWGNNFELLFGSGGDVVPDEVRQRLEADDDVAALMLYAVGQARVGRVTLGLAGMQPVKGDLAPRVLSGRVPSADDEVALGRLAAHDLDVRVGDDLTLDAAGRTRRYRVTGLAVIPPVEGLDGVGQDAVVTIGGLTRLAPESQPSAAAIKLRRGAPAGTAGRLELGLGGNSRPSVIVNLARIRSIPFVLAGLVGALAVLTLVHVMVTSVRNRRRDVAVLRSLGADGPMITRAVHWQATAFSLAPLALGAPLGLLAGRMVFELFARSVGAVPSASFPFALLAAVVAASVVLANAVAAVPAHRARHLAPAPLLAAE